MTRAELAALHLVERLLTEDRAQDALALLRHFRLEVETGATPDWPDWLKDAAETVDTLCNTKGKT